MIADANFAFRDVFRIPHLLSIPNVVSALSADYDILPGELSKVLESFSLPFFTSTANV